MCLDCGIMYRMEWTQARLEDTLEKLRSHGSETISIELKQAHDGYPKNTAETLCAFSNLPEGGTIIFGIDEKTFSPVGVYDIVALEEAVTATSRNGLEPKGNPEYTRVKVDGLDILIAQISPLPLQVRPCYYRGRAYMRYSDGDYAMDDYEITRILASRERKNSDVEVVPGTSIQDLDQIYSQNFIQEARLSSTRLRSLDNQALILARKSVLKEEQATLAGLYALGDYPQQFFPSLKISGVVEDENLRNLDKLETDGPLPEMLDHALGWLNRNLRTSIKENPDGSLVDQLEIPALALRELVANALVHRALDTDTARIKDITIRIKRDRIVITNPGGLWAVTTKNLAEPGHKTAVNPALYEICKLTRTSQGRRIIEGEGNGVYEAQKAMAEAGLEPIEFIDKGFQFTAIIRRPSPVGEMNMKNIAESQPATTAQIIYDYLLRVGEQGSQTIMQANHLSKRQVNYNLKKLEEEGKVVNRPSGQGRARLYRAV